MNGISYNNKHSFKDFNIKMLKSSEIKSPTKVKIMETVPFMNGSYDFSNLYGSAVFTDRQLIYEFVLKASNPQLLEFKRISVENWLMGSNEKTVLTDDNIKGYYFNAECINIDFENLGEVGKLIATFEAYPFRISNKTEGNELWDDFNFELDIMQDTKFEVKGKKEISIYNGSVIDVEPKVKTDSRFEIYQDDKKFIADAGVSGGHMFKLKKGENKLTLKGDGIIEFVFRKEVL